MFRLDDELKIDVHRDAVDFRKSINGLAAIVEQSMKLDPFAQAVYVFSNQRRDRIKMLLWDRNGFWLLIPPGELAGLLSPQDHTAAKVAATSNRLAGLGRWLCVGYRNSTVGHFLLDAGARRAGLLGKS